MIPKSLFLQWPLLLREQVRLLDDLAAFTPVNTIELSNFLLDWGATGWTHVPDAPSSVAALALPNKARFGALPVPVLADGEFEPLLKFMELAKARGFQIACNLTPLYAASPEIGSLACVDVRGARSVGPDRRLPVYACPNQLDALAYGRAMIEAFIRDWPQLDAIMVNHVEYPFWPRASVSELLTCFCEACREKAERERIDLDRVHHEVNHAYDDLLARWPRRDSRCLASTASLLSQMVARPLLAAWLHFRLSSMTEYVHALVRTGRETARAVRRDVKIGLEFQLATFAPIVGTDALALDELFDWMVPKFPDYLLGTVLPLIADELAHHQQSHSPSDIRRNLRELLDVGSGPQRYARIRDPKEGLIYSNAFDASVIDRQARYLSGFQDAAIVCPFIFSYKGGRRLLEQKLARLRANGYRGFFLELFDRDLTSAALRSMRDFW